MKKYTPLIAASLMLAALAPLQTRAAVNTWNGSVNSTWDTNTANWASPTIWVDGDDAIFGAAGAGTVTLGTHVAAHSITNTSADYTFASSGGNTLTLSGTTPTISVGSSNVVLALSLQGTAGLTVQGTSPTNKLTLESDIGFGLPNQYTGGTFVQSGTLILHASPVPAIRSIDQLDAGATVRYFNYSDGVSNFKAINGQILLTGYITMTGGTLDLAGDDNDNRVPVPSGTGTILNSSVYARAVLKMEGNGTTKTFSGVIADGGEVTNSIIPNKVSHRLDIDFAGGSGTFVMAGANTYSGSTRSGGGRTIQLSGAGTLGIPTIASPAIGVRINGGDGDPLGFDLNGTSQRISGMGGNGGRFGNTAVGTTSVLTIGKVDGSLDTGTPSWPGKFVDGGGILAIVKVGTNTQAFAGTGHTYSGDTTVSNGILAYTTVTAISPNSTIRLNTSAGNLGLSYAGTANVHGLYINGVSQPNGVYGSATAPIIGTGFIRVVGNLVASQSGNVITFSWDKPNSKLQAQTNSASVGITGTWFDYPGGGTSPVAVTISPANPTVFYRLAPLP